MKKIIVVITFCFLISCSIKESKNDNSQKKVFLELTLASTKNETMSQINSLIKSGRINKSQSNDWKGFYEYSFYVNGKEYNSYFITRFNVKGELLNSIIIEIQDPSKNIHIEDIYKLLAKKYGNANDSTITYYGDNSWEPFKCYKWRFKKYGGVIISVERTYNSRFNNSPDNTNFFNIVYEDSDISIADWTEEWIKNNNNIEGQKKTEKDL